MGSNATVGTCDTHGLSQTQIIHGHVRETYALNEVIGL